ncbi:hypothetical protein DSN00_25155 [Salmonella enterica subsp. enterica]|nr:hypothetical protein [Salmonella enterica subsp. enterica serovar Montevideo]
MDAVAAMRCVKSDIFQEGLSARIYENTSEFSPDLRYLLTLKSISYISIEKIMRYLVFPNAAPFSTLVASLNNCSNSVSVM